jgi:hypothetical protein
MSTTTLNKMIAVRKGLKTRTAADITELYQDLKKKPLFSGISRTYQPKDEHGTQMPPEYTKVQQTATDVLAKIGDSLAKLFDVVVTVDEGNVLARGTVTVDDTVLFDATVPTLLFAKEQITHLRTIITHLPILDPAVKWQPDTTGDAAWRSEDEQTLRTTKVPRNHVKAEATEKHPAQVEVYYEDVPVGTWTRVQFSGAVASKDRDKLLRRVNSVLDAIQVAVEEANAVEVEQKKIGEALFAFLLA